MPKKATKPSGNPSKPLRSVLIPALVTKNRTGLVPENPRIRGIAFKWRWRPETVIARVENALPSEIERTIYIDLAIGYRIHPESLRKMLDIFRGENHLSRFDLEKRSVGLNLIKSKFDDVVDKVELALNLIDKTTDCADYMMSMENAARLVEAYGEHAEEVLGLIVENVGDVAKLLGISLEKRSPRLVVGIAVTNLVKKVDNLQGDETLPLTVEEMFGKDSEQNHTRSRWNE